MNAHEVARALSARPTRTSRGWLAPCPAHADRDPSLHLSDGDNRLLVRCFAGCDQADVIEALTSRGLWGRNGRSAWHPPRPMPEPKPKTSSTAAHALRIWDEARSPARTLTDLYLAARGIRCAIPSSIRHHPALAYSHDGEVLGQFPAMVAAVTDLIGDKIKGIQRVYLSPAIDADPASKLMLHGPDGKPLKAKKALGDIDGNGVLFGSISRRHAVFIGEGLETVLSAVSLTGRPGIAAVSAGNLPKLRLPSVARLIYLLVDPDPTGERKSREAADHWHREGRRVRMVEVA